MRLILNDHSSDFDALLQNNNDTCNHNRNIQTLMVDIYKIKNSLNHPMMEFMFVSRNNTYKLRVCDETKKYRKNGS